MKNVLIALVVLAVAATAYAGQNPNIAAYLVDNATGIGNNQVCPAVNGMFNVYLCFDRFGEGGGTIGCAFLWTRTFSGFRLSLTNLLGGLTIGDPEVAPGYAMLSASSLPVYPNADGIVVAATAMYMYIGTPGTLVLGPHGVDGAKVLDANGVADYFCVHSVLYPGTSGHFGVCATPPDGDCEPESAVESSSWGTIKALYR
jgi:hypothetical protein